MGKFNLAKPSIPALNRAPLRRVTGEPVWHDLTPTRFILPVPTGREGPKQPLAKKQRALVVVPVEGSLVAKTRKPS